MRHPIDSFTSAFDFRGALIDASSKTFSEAADTFVRSELSSTVAAGFANLAGEFAKELAGPFTRLALAALLRRADQSANDLALLKNAPFRSGFEAAKRGFAIRSTAPGDVRQREHDLEYACAQLDTAFSLTSQREVDKQLFIRTLQGFISREQSAPARAAAFFAQVEGPLRARLHEALIRSRPTREAVCEEATARGLNADLFLQSDEIAFIFVQRGPFGERRDWLMDDYLRIRPIVEAMATIGADVPAAESITLAPSGPLWLASDRYALHLARREGPTFLNGSRRKSELRPALTAIGFEGLVALEMPIASPVPLLSFPALTNVEERVRLGTDIMITWGENAQPYSAIKRIVIPFRPTGDAHEVLHGQTLSCVPLGSPPASIALPVAAPKRRRAPAKAPVALISASRPQAKKAPRRKPASAESPAKAGKRSGTASVGTDRVEKT